MERLKDIEKKIKRIKITKRLTKALSLVALNLIYKNQKKLTGVKLYSDEIRKIFHILIKKMENEISHPFIKTDKDENTILILILTSDKGLCGNYNVLIFETLNELVKKLEGKKREFYAVGKEGVKHLRKNQINISKHYFKVSENPTVDHADEITNDIIEAFLYKDIDTVYILYSKFISFVYQKPVFFKILPIDKDIFTVLKDEEKDLESEYLRFLLEPSGEKIFSNFINKYINSIIYKVLVEASLSENASRHMAMQKATNNAEEMVNILVKRFKRARQENISRELEDIILTSQALKKISY